jgi:hypothetical protein
MRGRLLKPESFQHGEYKGHSTAEPQPNSTSVAKADGVNLNFGRVEARPSGEIRKYCARRDEFED